MTQQSTGLTHFKVEINGGPEQDYFVKTSEYCLAAVSSLGHLDYVQAADYQVVKIWVPHLVEAGYGPYFYAWDGQRTGYPEKEREW